LATFDGLYLNRLLSESVLKEAVLLEDKAVIFPEVALVDYDVNRFTHSLEFEDVLSSTEVLELNHVVKLGLILYNVDLIEQVFQDKGLIDL
jgi:hypothetical protein